MESLEEREDLPRDRVSSLVATQAPRDSFQMVLYDLFMVVLACLLAGVFGFCSDSIAVVAGHGGLFGCGTWVVAGG